MKQRSKIVALIIVLSMLLSMAVPAFAQVSDLEGHWAKEEISYMVSEGILNGYPDGTFRPNNNISKAEFYKIINSLMGYEELSDVHFKDVDPNSWMHEHVAKALGAGYLLNLDEEYLNPTELITREEVARIIGYTFKLKENSEPAAEFSDYALISASSVGFVGALKEKGYISGYPDGSFAPAGNITRAEVVKMLYNILTAEGLPKEVDLSDYEAALKAVKEADYTAKSWKEYQKVVKANEMTEENTQEEIDAATETILEAQEDLVRKSKSSGSSGGSTNPDDPVNVNKTALAFAIATANGKEEEDYTVESWELFEEALDEARAVINDNGATQKEVDDALEDLRDTMSALVLKGDEEPEVDKTDLEEAIDEAETKVEEDYTIESWAAFAEALNTAIAVYDDTDATQAEVDDALIGLVTAMTNLVEKPSEPEVDKLALAAKIEEAESLSEEEYTEESWSILQSALTEAREVNANPNATQEEVDDTLADLTAAIEALEERPEEPAVEKTELLSAIEFAEDTVLGEVYYSPDTWSEFITAYDNAVEVYDDDEAIQDEVDEAAKALLDAIESLELVLPAIVNIQPNEDVTLKAGETLEVSFKSITGGQGYYRLMLPYEEPMSDGFIGSQMIEGPSGFYSGTWTAPEEHELVDLQIEVIFITPDGDRLSAFAEGRVTVTSEEELEVDKAALAEVIEAAEALNEEDYTVESWVALEAALASAQAVYAADDATQQEVDDAVEELEAAIDGLVEKPEEPAVDKTALVAKIAKAQALIADEYTEESWAELETALSAAQAVYDDIEATQEQVDAATDALNAAIEALVEAVPVGEPELTAYYRTPLPLIPALIEIFVDVEDLDGATLFDVVYQLSGGDESNTEKYAIGTWTTESIFFNPSTISNTVTIRIYDINEAWLYTFENVHLVLPQ